jgi:hypothetical protein
METKVEFGLVPIYALLAGPAIKAFVTGLRFPQRHYKDFADKRKQCLATIDEKQIRVLAALLVAVREDVTPESLVASSAAELVPKINFNEQLENASYLPFLRDLETLGAARERLVSLPDDAKRWALLKAVACVAYFAAFTFLAIPYIFKNVEFSNRSLVTALVITAVTLSFAVGFFVLETLMERRMVSILNEHG